MKAIRWLLRTFLLAVPAISIANESFVFFDLKRCESGAAENEPLTGNRTYEHWVKKANAIKGVSSKETWSQWEVFYTAETRMGICKTTFSTSRGLTEIYCQNESLNDFELAGAKYIAVRNKSGHLLRYKCASGCTTRTPEFIYRQIESDEEFEKGPDELALLNAYREFDALCTKK